MALTSGDTSDLWWKNAIVYCLDVETFHDAGGDGCGDLRGLLARLDHLAGLGVTCLWLMPFYRTANRDDGYDVVDFYAVDPALGTSGDLVEVVRAAGDRGMRVIADLVVNHTSREHPWFASARASRDSPHRSFYVWADEKPADDPEMIVFPDAETSNWEWDEEAGQYYFHVFYAHQPDLNVAEPAVREEITRVMGYWLQQGLAGFRVDAVPFLIQADAADGAVTFEPHGVLRALSAFTGRRRGDGVLLGEVNLPPEEQRAFFGETGDELQLVFNFTVNQAMYLALARRDPEPLRRALRALPDDVPRACGWANFVRNHDELSLDKLTDDERAEVFAAFGPDPDLQLFGRGLRRRLPSMLGGDPRRVRMVYSLMFALPGTPVLFYGEEIGMAENLDIPGRMSVRSPMQWSSGAGAGFSSAPASALRRPVTGGAFGPDAVNVADQRRDPGSLLAWMERLLRLRRECPELGFGEWALLDAGPSVLALRVDWQGDALVTLHNFAAEEVEVRLGPGDVAGAGALVDLLDPEADARAGADGAVRLTVPSDGHRWLRAR